MNGPTDVRRRQPPPDHLISGHPHAGRKVLPARDAAATLGVTTTTVRTWIDEGTVAGFCVRSGRVYRYFAYEDAVEAVQTSRASAHGSLRSRVQRVEAQVASMVGGANSRIGLLEQVIRSQASAMDELRAAFLHQQTATELLVQAAAAQRQASLSYARAEQLAADIGAGLGVPDFPPT